MDLRARRRLVLSAGLIGVCFTAGGAVRADSRRVPDNRPIRFELNQGQVDGQVRFLGRGPGFSMFLTGTEAIIAPQSSAKPRLRMTVLRANPRSQTVGLSELPGKANYYLGKDPSKWRVNVPTYARVKYSGVYPGIDLVYYSDQGQLEYDFIVAPGANPTAIGLAVDDVARGAETTAAPFRLESSGDLIVATKGGELRFHRPVLYQSAPGGGRISVDGHYAKRGKGEIGFEVGRYDRTKPLVIDPVLTYSTYLGGGQTEARAVKLDSAGNIYVVGTTNSLTFPTVNPAQGNAPFGDGFVSKFTPDGSALVYSTYFGGNGFDQVNGIAVDTAGNAFVTGFTQSTDLPILNALQPAITPPGTPGSGEAFVAKFSPGGSLIFSTYLGGSLNDAGTSVAVDAAGYAYIAGVTTSTDFPVTAGAFQRFHGGTGFEIYNPNADAFVAKIRPDGSALEYSTFLGGNNFLSDGNDDAAAIAVDGTGNAYVVGTTSATDFPVTGSAFQPGSPGSQNNAFVSKLSPNGSSLLYSTYIGGTCNPLPPGFLVTGAFGLAADDTGHAFVAGVTECADFPIVNALQGTFGGGSSYDTFIARFDTTQSGASSLQFSTFFGGSGAAVVAALALDGAGHLYIAGGAHPPIPTTQGALQPECIASSCGFLSKFTVDGSHLLYSTYLAGSRFSTGVSGLAATPTDVLLTGTTESPDFPITANAFQTTFQSSEDAFVTRLHFRLFIPPVIDPLPVLVSDGSTFAFTVGPVDDLVQPLTFDAVGVPAGITVSPSHFELAPTPDTGASQTLTTDLGISVTPGTYSFSVVEHTTNATTPVTVNVTASTAGTVHVIDTLRSLGCIDSAGVANALSSKLTAAQSQVGAGQVQAALNTYEALLNQLRAQNGKHLTSACVSGGVTFNPAAVLASDTRDLSAHVASAVANPVLGYVVDAANGGIAGATVSLFDASNALIATVTTDVTGFYFFATTAASPGAQYQAVVTKMPSPFSTSSPASQTFTWTGGEMILSNFTLH
jgi:hypothetical protein